MRVRLANHNSFLAAIGITQLILITIRKLDLWDSNADVIGSVANYFSRHGWRYDQPVLSSISTGNISSLRTESKKSYKPSTRYAVYLSKGLKSIEDISEDEKLSVIVRKEQSGDVFNFAHKNFMLSLI